MTEYHLYHVTASFGHGPSHSAYIVSTDAARASAAFQAILAEQQLYGAQISLTLIAKTPAGPRSNDALYLAL